MIRKGYIEGFYGKLMNWEDRSYLLKTLSNLSLDFYIYGPKEDPFHRADWSAPYPKDTLIKFQGFKQEASKLGLRSYFALSPGVPSGKNKQAEYKALKEKIKQLVNVGFDDFAIFFDDIDSERNGNLGKRHGEILNFVQEILNVKREDSLIFCPTVYCDSFAKGPLVDSEYLKVLSEEIPVNLPMLWTGKEVVSETISDVDILALEDVIGNPVIIWDNYYANDYCPTNFFIGPHEGRNLSEESVIGLGINPTGLPITDSIILHQVEGSQETEEILKQFGVPDCFNELIPFFRGPFNQDSSLVDIEKVKSIKVLSTQLCIEWKSDLQLEWSPFLWTFFNDLNFLLKLKQSEDKKELEHWASRRYSNPLLKVIFIREENN